MVQSLIKLPESGDFGIFNSDVKPKESIIQQPEEIKHVELDFLKKLFWKGMLFLHLAKYDSDKQKSS